MSLKNQFLLLFIIASMVLYIALYFILIRMSSEFYLERTYDQLKIHNESSLKTLNTALSNINVILKKCDTNLIQLQQDINETDRDELISNVKIIDIKNNLQNFKEQYLLDEQNKKITFLKRCTLNYLKAVQFDFNFNWISSQITNYYGLGQSGESYIVSENGHLLTSSRFTKYPQPSSIPVFDQLKIWQGIKNDYRNIPVLAFWTKYKIDGLDKQFYIASEIDVEEYQAPINRIQLSINIIFFSVFLLTLYITFQITKAIMNSHELKQKLSEIEAQGQEQGKINERRRIGLELHDDISQNLAAMKWSLDLLNVNEPDKVNLSDRLDIIISKIRNLTKHLSEDYHDFNESIVKLIENQIEHINKDNVTKINFKFNYDQSLSEVKIDSQEVNFHLSRIIQESLNNIIKHSNAKNTFIYLNESIKDNSSHLELVIEDDGHFSNFDHVEFENHFGISNMKNRAGQMKATIKFEKSKLGGLKTVLTI